MRLCSDVLDVSCHRDPSPSGGDPIAARGGLAGKQDRVFIVEAPPGSATLL